MRVLEGQKESSKGEAPSQISDEETRGRPAGRLSVIENIELVMFGNKGRRVIGDSRVEGKGGEVPPEADSKHNFSFRFL